MKNRKALIVKTRSGKKGFLYREDYDRNRAGVPIFLIDENFQETGEKIYCRPETLEIIGYKD